MQQLILFFLVVQLGPRFSASLEIQNVDAEAQGLR